MPGMMDTTTTGGTQTDPRTKILILLIINAVLFGPSTNWVLILSAPVVIILLINSGAKKTALTLTIFGLLMWAISVLPQLVPHPILAVIGLIGYWLMRLTISIGLATWLWVSTPVGHLIAAFQQLRLPSWVVIPLAVVFRFIPVVINECIGIFEAMALRGWTGRDMILHPWKTTGRILVPLLSSTARLADELSAAALIRGLGAPGKSTVTVDLHFRISDALLLVWAGVIGGVFWAMKSPGIALWN